MKQYWLRSTIFNVCFYVITGLACIACLPTLVMPRGAFMCVVHGWTWFVHKLEKYILGLDFEIRGLENIPDDGSFIVAAKHQSAYETMKLHALFGDPAIILKQELLKIPLWGKYLGKTRPIAIDRSDKDSAIQSIQDGAVSVKQQGRPIIIFPQGTRVWIHETPEQKPYRVGIARMQEATGLSIVPMALNTGFFWPRKGWCKRPGKVVFEFLPVIKTGMERSALLAELETQIEAKSNALLKEAQDAEANKKRTSLFGIIGLGALILVLIAYAFYWFYVAGIVEKEHSLFLTKSEQIEQLAASNAGKINRNFTGASVSGFPAHITLNIAKESFSAPTFNLNINDITAKSLPFPYMPITINTGAISFQSFMQNAPIEMDSLSAKFTPKTERLDIEYAYLKRDDFEIFASGFVTQDNTGNVGDVDITVTMKNVEGYLKHLQEIGILNGQSALFVGAGLNSFKQDGVVTIPITVSNKQLFAGPFMILRLP